MNDDTGDRRQWRELPRWAGILAAIVSIILLTSGCGGGGTPAGSSASPSPASTQAKLIAWAQCMRTHGVPNFPDPNSQGEFNGNAVNPNSPQVQSAQKACKSLQPNIGSGQSQAQMAAQALRFSRCMRSHGVSNYPDPNSKGQLHLGINSGINPQSSTFQSAQRACQSLMSPALGQQSGG